MLTITIPEKLAKKDDLVVIPRKEYEEFAKWRDVIKSFRIFTPTPTQKADLKKAREDYKKGRHLTFNELKRRLKIKS